MCVYGNRLLEVLGGTGEEQPVEGAPPVLGQTLPVLRAELGHGGLDPPPVERLGPEGLGPPARRVAELKDAGVVAAASLTPQKVERWHKCQRSCGSPRWRPWVLPARGHENSPRVARWVPAFRWVVV